MRTARVFLEAVHVRQRMILALQDLAKSLNPRLTPATVSRPLLEFLGLLLFPKRSRDGVVRIVKQP
jgi:hypothetical protein